MSVDMSGLILHAILVFMSGIGITLLVRAERNLDRYCSTMEAHTKALEAFVEAATGKALQK